ncbi:translation elongation factor 1-alpha, partial [Striga asiatica]
PNNFHYSKKTRQNSRAAPAELRHLKKQRKTQKQHHDPNTATAYQAPNPGTTKHSTHKPINSTREEKNSLAKQKSRKQKPPNKFHQEFNISITRYHNNLHHSLGTLLSCSLCDLSTRSILLLNTLDHTNSYSLPHVTNSKSSKWRVLGKGLNHHRLSWNHLDKPSISIFQELGLLLELLTRSPVNLGHKFSKLDSNVRSVAVEHRCISLSNLSRVIHDNHLRGKVSSFLSRIFLRVRGNITALEILNSNILHVEPDIITWESFLHCLVVHLNRFNFSGQTRRAESHHHTRLQNTRLYTANWDSSNTTNLVDVLKGKAKRLSRASKRVGPLYQSRFVDLSIMLSPSKPEMGTKGILSGLYPTFLRYEETSFTISSYLALEYLGVVASICMHKQSMLTCLTILGNTSFKTTSCGIDDENSTVSLRGTSNHVLDKVTVSGGINDSAVVLGGFEFPESNINCDATFTLGLELVEHPGILE